MNRYRINLYRERESADRRYRRGLLGAGFFGVVVGVEILLLALLAVSGNLIRERNAVLRESLSSLRAESAAPQTGPAVEVARTLVLYRTGRIDWAQMIQGVSESIPDNVTLTRISGGLTLSDGSTPGLDLEGRVGNAAELEPVLGFVGALRANPRIAAALPSVDLETVESERTRTFKVICRKPTTTEAAS